MTQWGGGARIFPRARLIHHIFLVGGGYRPKKTRMITVCPKRMRDRAVDGGFGCAAVVGVVLGTTTAVVSDLFCGSGYMLAGGISLLSMLMIRNLRVARDLSQSVERIEAENMELRASNLKYTEENGKLTESNRMLHVVSQQLDSDVEMLTSSMKIAGESRRTFMDKLRATHLALREENEKHRALNVQQGRLQLLQLFRHFDTNSDLEMDQMEVQRAIGFLRHAFPSLDVDALIAASREGSITYEQLQSTVIVSPPSSSR